MREKGGKETPKKEMDNPSFYDVNERVGCLLGEWTLFTEIKTQSMFQGAWKKSRTRKVISSRLI